MPNFDIPVPGITPPRVAPAYDYDSAIRRRMDPINQLDDSANSYAKTLADRRVEQANQASQARMQALANSQRAQQAANYAKASKATTAPAPTINPARGAQFKPGYANQMSILNKMFPGVKATSTNEGSHASGSWHYKGRAVDLPASMAIYNWIKTNYPNSRELIFSGGGNTQIKNGKVVPASFYGSKTMSEHGNHIHWAY